MLASSNPPPLPLPLQAYWQHLHFAYYVAPVGLALLLATGLLDPKRRYSGVQARWRMGRQAGGAAPVHAPLLPPSQVAKWFVILYAAIAYYFSQRMSRLIILLGPVSSVLAGIALGGALGWAYDQSVMVRARARIHLPC